MANPIVPPLLKAIKTTDPTGDAIKNVRSQTAGAGNLFWAPGKSTADLAIVLEPEVDRLRALEMLPLAMVALSDCLAVLLPPQVAVQFRGSNDIIVNGGHAGSVKVALAKTSNDKMRPGSPGSHDGPDWLVLSIKIALTSPDKDIAPGVNPDVTSLDEEGWEQPDLNKFIETYARHFLSWMAAWNDQGFAPVARAWKFKAEDQKDPDLSQVSHTAAIYESKI